MQFWYWTSRKLTPSNLLRHTFVGVQGPCTSKLCITTAWFWPDPDFLHRKVLPAPLSGLAYKKRRFRVIIAWPEYLLTFPWLIQTLIISSYVSLGTTPPTQLNPTQPKFYTLTTNNFERNNKSIEAEPWGKCGLKSLAACPVVHGSVSEVWHFSVIRRIPGTYVRLFY